MIKNFNKEVNLNAVEIENEELLDEAEEETSLIYTSLDFHDYNHHQSSIYVISFISGFVACKARKFSSSCQGCTKSLETEYDEKREGHRYIRLLDRGNLVYPTEKLENFIKYLEDIVMTVVCSQGIYFNTFHLIIDAVIREHEEKRNYMAALGCENHQYTIIKKILWYFLYTRAFFLCKAFNKYSENENIKNKTKNLRKIAKHNMSEKK